MSLQLIRYIADISAVVVAVALALTIFKRHPDQIGNRLMSLSIGLIGLYSFSFLMLDLIALEWAIQIFLRIGIASILFACIFMYFSFQILLHSSKWLEIKKNTLPLIIIGILYSLLLLSTNLITINSLSPVDTQLDLIILGILLIILLVLTLYNIYAVYTGGIKKTDNLTLKKRLQYIFLGLLVFLLVLVFVVISNVAIDKTIGSIFDILCFVGLIIGLLLMSIGFLKKE